MREYTQEKKAKLVKLVCNGCGKSIAVKNDVAPEDWLSVDKTWGYFSEKDGQIHAFDLCEACYDKLTKGFALPVTVKKQRELL